MKETQIPGAVQAKRYSRLEKILATHYGKESLVPLRDLVESIARISKVHVRKCDNIDYDEISLLDIGNDGIVKVVDDPDKKPANTSALQRQRLHKGDLVFGYRGKLGKIGLVDHEHERPLIGNHGMMRIRFHDGDKQDLPKYVQAYLQTNLIKTFLAATMEDRQLTPELIGGIPIPMLRTMDGMSPFSTIHDKRVKIRQKLESLLQKALSRENESLLLINKPATELSATISQDNSFLEEVESLERKVEVDIPERENVLLIDFEDVMRE